jgi:hypothetical protein
LTQIFCCGAWSLADPSEKPSALQRFRQVCKRLLPCRRQHGSDQGQQGRLEKQKARGGFSGQVWPGLARFVPSLPRSSGCYGRLRRWRSPARGREHPIDITIRPASEDDADECGRICYLGFRTVNERHGFPTIFPSVEVATRRATGFIRLTSVFAIVAESRDNARNPLGSRPRSPSTCEDAVAWCSTHVLPMFARSVVADIERC